MWSHNIQLGVDLATAFSVAMAAFFYIREVQRNRAAEKLEQHKERNLRRNEFKLEKASEVIRFLSAKEYEMRHVCEQIDSRLKLMESPENAADMVVKFSKQEKEKICDVDDAVDFRFVPDEYRIAGKVKELLKLLREVSSYIDRNPFIKYLLDDQEVNRRVSEVVGLNELHGTIANKEVTHRKTLFMVVNDFETQSSALGVYLYGSIKAGRNVIMEGRNVIELKQELEKTERNITKRESDKLFARACQQDFMGKRSSNPICSSLNQAGRVSFHCQGNSEPRSSSSSRVGSVSNTNCRYS